MTSDHRASLLAVMFGRENKFKMKSVGEHGGRCCPANDIDEKNYDRFAGGRLSSVEVHGGATLEETLVPVIEFSLPNAEIEVKVSSAEKIPAALKELDEGFDFFD